MMKNQKGMSLIKLIIIIVIVIFVGILLFGGSDNTNTSTTTSQSNNIQTLKVGDTWTVDGQWKLTINSVTTTSYRNQYSDYKPAQVVYISYSYENIGYYDNFYNEDTLYFALDPDVETIVVDSNGEVGYSYPGEDGGAKETPQGAKCMNATSCIGLNNFSDSITVSISKTDGNGTKQSVKYILDVD